MSSYPYKRRRTATSVLAGDFDPRPPRDVLTSLLNGVPTPKPTEEEAEARRNRKREKKERQREKRDKEEKKRAKAAARAADKAALANVASTSATAPPALHGASKTTLPPPRVAASSFWQARPTIMIPNLQRSASFSPPPMPSSPPTTPGPSISSRTSATSSKRPYTPEDGEDIDGRNQSVESQEPQPKKPRKKREAARKGWKGWVEGSPPPSEKLINLDVATILPERKTRSGKSFDAIGVGKEGWV
ncbi:hypothetical protein C8Q70DRAFT_305461 [Cubamyces menziesii]|uniref:Uncharacterized protein n=1 Tax=Trametes cubensis TaxID=1111947 RepID=A0AAD7XG38_9APHY|nr:hypothetical protein C8Q70DRAFT_305461 [Cubamyces menziesii]KAJ8502241.1 hypothetical protein ONZ51_g107 [Trametes cubensis]